jgi:hypothetical protein
MNIFNNKLNKKIMSTNFDYKTSKMILFYSNLTFIVGINFIVITLWNR